MVWAVRRRVMVVSSVLRANPVRVASGRDGCLPRVRDAVGPTGEFRGVCRGSLVRQPQQGVRVR